MENVKKVLFLVCEVGNVLGAAKADDGKIDMTDLPKLVSLYDEVMALFGLEFSKVLAEAKNLLTPVQFSEVMAECAVKFDIPNDQVEAKIEATIEGVGMFISGANKIIAAWKK